MINIGSSGRQTLDVRSRDRASTVAPSRGAASSSRDDFNRRPDLPEIRPIQVEGYRESHTSRSVNILDQVISSVATIGEKGKGRARQQRGSSQPAHREDGEEVDKRTKVMFQAPHANRVAQRGRIEDWADPGRPWPGYSEVAYLRRETVLTEGTFVPHEEDWFINYEPTWEPPDAWVHMEEG